MEKNDKKGSKDQGSPELLDQRLSKKEFIGKLSKVVAGTFLGAAILPIASGCEARYDDYMAYGDYGAYSNYDEYSASGTGYCDTPCQDYSTTSSSGYCNYLDYCDTNCIC